MVLYMTLIIVTRDDIFIEIIIMRKGIFQNSWMINYCSCPHISAKTSIVDSALIIKRIQYLTEALKRKREFCRMYSQEKG